MVPGLPDKGAPRPALAGQAASLRTGTPKPRYPLWPAGAIPHRLPGKTAAALTRPIPGSAESGILVRGSTGRLSVAPSPTRTAPGAPFPSSSDHVCALQPIRRCRAQRAPGKSVREPESHESRHPGKRYCECSDTPCRQQARRARRLRHPLRCHRWPSRSPPGKRSPSRDQRCDHSFLPCPRWEIR